MVEQSQNPVEYRPGNAADDYDLFLILEAALADLIGRLGFTGENGGEDEAALAQLWQSKRPIYAHLRQTADQFWVAQQKGQTVGFARSVLRVACAN
jgi:hypothetical protein